MQLKTGRDQAIMSICKVVLVVTCLILLCNEVKSLSILPHRCNTFCPYIYQPVCGRNCKGKLETFSNLCLLKNFNCKNPCKAYTTYTKGKCEKPCRYHYPPVYGTDYPINYYKDDTYYQKDYPYYFNDYPFY